MMIDGGDPCLVHVKSVLAELHFKVSSYGFVHKLLQCGGIAKLADPMTRTDEETKGEGALETEGTRNKEVYDEM